MSTASATVAVGLLVSAAYFIFRIVVGTFGYLAFLRERAVPYGEADRHLQRDRTAISIRELLERCREVANVAARLVWVPDQFLAEQKVTPFVGLPLWIPATIDPGAAMRANTARARTLGLRSRPIAETIGATLGWCRMHGESGAPTRSITRERERQILDAWRSTQDRP